MVIINIDIGVVVIIIIIIIIIIVTNIIIIVEIISNIITTNIKFLISSESVTFYLEQIFSTTS